MGWTEEPILLQSQPELGPEPGSTFYGCGTLSRSLPFYKNLFSLENEGDSISIFSHLPPDGNL